MVLWLLSKWQTLDRTQVFQCLSHSPQDLRGASHGDHSPPEPV